MSCALLLVSCVFSLCSVLCCVLRACVVYVSCMYRVYCAANVCVMCALCRRAAHTRQLTARTQDASDHTPSIDPPTLAINNKYIVYNLACPLDVDVFAVFFSGFNVFAVFSLILPTPPSVKSEREHENSLQTAPKQRLHTWVGVHRCDRWLYWRGYTTSNCVPSCEYLVIQGRGMT